MSETSITATASQAALLSGVMDEELMQLMVACDEISMRNTASFHYIEYLRSKKFDDPVESANASEPETSQKPESLLLMLDTLTNLHLDSICSTAASEELAVTERDLFLTYQERHDEFQKLNKMFSDATKNPEASELFEKSQQVVAAVESARANSALIESQCKELEAELECKEKTIQETLEIERQKLADVEKSIRANQAVLDAGDENTLREEVASLTAQHKENRRLLKEWDDDDDSSIYSEALEGESSEVTPKKIPQVDFGRFFKNPNDFPDLKQLLGPSPKQNTSKNSSNARESVPKPSTSVSKDAKSSSRKLPTPKASKNSPKPKNSLKANEKILYKMRNIRSSTQSRPMPVEDLTEPPKKIIRIATPLPKVPVVTKPADTEVEVEKVAEVVAPRPEVEDVVMEPRVLIQEFDDTEVEEKSEFVQQLKHIEQPMEVAESRPQSSESSSDSEDDTGDRDDGQIIAEDETKGGIEAPIERNVVMPKAVAVENGQFVYAEPTTTASSTNSESSLFGNESELNTSGATKKSDVISFDASFSGDDMDGKANEQAGEKSFDFNISLEAFDFFGAVSKKPESGGFF